VSEYAAIPSVQIDGALLIIGGQAVAPIKDRVDQRFGRLIVMALAGTRRQTGALWVCRCDCGATLTVQANNLKSGNTASCGCLKLDITRQVSTRHGRTHTPAYWRWRAMIQRCTNPRNRAWANYGGRGIQVCPAWRTFDGFYRDMGDPPSGMTLDRIDVNGGYCPENCRWATQSRQARNKRRTPLYTLHGTTQSLSDWADQLGANMRSLHSRLRRGWSVERILTTPVVR
jgi:hypothetical protein